MKENEESKFSFIEKLRENTDFDEFMSGALSSVGFSTATTSYISMVSGCIDKPETYPYFVAGGMVMIPVFYMIIKKIRKLQELEYQKGVEAASELLTTMIKEAKEQHNNEQAPIFFNDLDLRFRESGVIVSQEVIYQINRLLCFVNSEYYEEISKSSPMITSEILINHMINQIVEFYKSSGKQTFDANDASEIIRGCSLINPKLTEEIIEDYQGTKMNRAEKVVQRHQNKVSCKKKKPKKKHTANPTTTDGFDITSESDLNSVILATSKHEFYRKFGNPDELTWDMDFMKSVLTIISTNYNNELKDYHYNYSTLALAASFITNTVTYALINEKKEIGQDEMLIVLKDWNYLPRAMRDKVMTKLYDDNVINYGNSQYRTSGTYSYKKASANS